MAKVKLSEIDIEPYNTLLLDRDGTLNVHLVGDYVKQWSEFEFIPGVLEAMPALASHFRHIFVVTNQRGIGRGIYSEADFETVTSQMMQAISDAGGRIDGVYHCSSVDESEPRRKPQRGMFDEIRRDYPDVEPAKTLMVGDGDVDMEFARNCGIAFCRVDSLKKENGAYKWIKA